MEWSLIGHEKQREHLARLIGEERLSHAYLFAGPEGVGKRMVARDVVAALVPAGYSLDRLELAPERDEDGTPHDIPVEAAEGLRAWLALRPLGQRKVVIIDEADRLGDKTGEMLLKILEEPPVYAHFILITSRPGAILPTIFSRCERMDFMPLTDAQMHEALGKQKMDEDDRALLAIIAAGRPGAALQLAGKRLKSAAKAIAGLETALKSGIAERLVYAKTLADADDTPEVVGWWLVWTRAHLTARPQLARVAAGLLELHDAVSESSFNRRLALDRFFLDIPGHM